MKQKPDPDSDETWSLTSKLPNLPFPKKVTAIIRDVPLSAAQKNPPPELSRTLKKCFQSLGPDIVADYAQVFAQLSNRFVDVTREASVAEAFAYLGEMMGTLVRDNPTFSGTLPIVLERFGSAQPELIGSGVLIRIMGRFFLLTAAHVTDWQRAGILLIPSRQGFAPIRGFLSAMRLPDSGSRSDDNLDVAYFRLADDYVQELHPRCTILERGDVSLEAEPVRRNDYTFAGFPWRKGKVKKEAIVTHFQTMTGAEAKKSEYEALGLSSGTLQVSNRKMQAEACQYWLE